MGCLAFYRLSNPKRDKLGKRTLKSVFVGYAKNSKAYELFNVDSNLIVESKDVYCAEEKFIFNSTEQDASEIFENNS